MIPKAIKNLSWMIKSISWLRLSYFKEASAQRIFLHKVNKLQLPNVT